MKMSQTTTSNFCERAAEMASRPQRALLTLKPSSDRPVSNARRMDFSSSTIKTCGFDMLILRLLLRQRQAQSEDGTDSDLALHRNRQARHAIEFLEDQRDRLRRNPAALIFHFDSKKVALGQRFYNHVMTR